MTCPNCGENLEIGDVDCRQEWRTIQYHCFACKKDFKQTTTYKPQSSLVALDELEEVTI